MSPEVQIYNTSKLCRLLKAHGSTSATEGRVKFFKLINFEKAHDSILFIFVLYKYKFSIFFSHEKSHFERVIVLHELEISKYCILFSHEKNHS